MTALGVVAHDILYDVAVCLRPDSQPYSPGDWPTGGGGTRFEYLCSTRVTPVGHLHLIF